MENELDYKIEKYTFKLKHAPNRKIADIYQNKLLKYHRQRKYNLIEFSGGGEIIGGGLSEKIGHITDTIKNLKAELFESEKKLKEVKSNVVPEINKNIEYLSEKIEEISGNINEFESKFDETIKLIDNPNVQFNHLKIEPIKLKLSNLTNKINNISEKIGYKQFNTDDDVYDYAGKIINV